MLSDDYDRDRVLIARTLELERALRAAESRVSAAERIVVADGVKISDLGDEIARSRAALACVLLVQHSPDRVVRVARAGLDMCDGAPLRTSQIEAANAFIGSIE